MRTATGHRKMLPAVPWRFAGNVLVPTATPGPWREVHFLPAFPPRSLGKSPCKQFPIHTWESGLQSGHVASRPDNGTEDLASGEIWRSLPPSRPAGRRPLFQRLRGRVAEEQPRPGSSPTSRSKFVFTTGRKRRMALKGRDGLSKRPSKNGHRDRGTGARKADREMTEHAPPKTHA